MIHLALVYPHKVFLCEAEFVVSAVALGETCCALTSGLKIRPSTCAFTHSWAFSNSTLDWKGLAIINVRFFYLFTCRHSLIPCAINQ